MKMIIKSIFIILIILVFSCGRESEKSITKLDDLKTVSIGAMTGTTGEALAHARFPDAQVKSFDDVMDAIAALKAGQIDAVITAFPTAVNICKHNKELQVLSEAVDFEYTAIALKKGREELLAALNKFIAQLQEDGILQDMKRRWFKKDSLPYEKIEIELPETGKTIKIGTSATREPFCFVDENQKVTGHDGEFARRIAVELGRPLQFVDMKFSALIPALQSGKIDLIVTGMTATEERKKSVDFTTSYFTNSQVILCKNKNHDETQTKNTSENLSRGGGANKNETFYLVSFFRSAAKSFNNNIILEKRYLLILGGLYTTILISILSTIFGTMLGGLICFMRMSKKRILLLPSKLFISLLRGTPVLVVLMLIFYVVFASVDIDPVFVAVIAFGLNFAAYVSEMFRTGIEGVDSGQTEAGIAMGFTKVKTFIFVILPQAVQRILPVYKGEVISLVKMTSIVGYIAVQDLTKASDIIRSRTFDAFFPLIMVAVLYFLISWILMFALGYIEQITNPKLKTKQG